MKLILLDIDLGYETHNVSYEDDKVKLVLSNRLHLDIFYCKFLNVKLVGMFCIQEISTISNENYQ